MDSTRATSTTPFRPISSRPPTRWPRGLLMNLPSLALPRSKFFQSRLGILVLALVAVLLGGAAFFALRPVAPPTLPTPATSPAAQAPVRAVPVRPVPAPPKVVEVAPDTYGPLTPGMT